MKTTMPGPKWLRALLLAAISTSALNCQAPEPTTGKWFETTDSAATRAVAESPDLCLDCIQIETLVVLGEDEELGFLMGDEKLVRDSLGNYWAGGNSGIKVFGPDGSFLREVGRPGQGPLEFSRPAPVFTDSSGRVHIIDLGNRRETVLNADFTLAFERGLPMHFQAQAPLADGERYVINTWISNPDKPPEILHIIHGEEVLDSFCELGIDFDGPEAMVASERALGVDGNGRIIAIQRYGLGFEAWTGDGRRIMGFQGPRLNASDPRPEPLSPENPLPTQVMGIYIDDQSRLWVAMVEPNDGWFEVLESQGDGAIYTDLLSGRIDVIDLNSASVVARLRSDGLFAGFLGNGDLVEGHMLSDGTPLFAVYRVRLDLEVN